MPRRRPAVCAFRRRAATGPSRSSVTVFSIYGSGRKGMSKELIFALACSIAAIVYGVVSIGWIMAKPSGNERMREIAAAIQAGAQAYLNRQYLTIAVVGVLLFVAIWWALGG